MSCAAPRAITSAAMTQTNVFPVDVNDSASPVHRMRAIPLATFTAATKGSRFWSDPLPMPAWPRKIAATSNAAPRALTIPAETGRVGPSSGLKRRISPRINSKSASTLNRVRFTTLF